jgi:hypothetical protein
MRDCKFLTEFHLYPAWLEHAYLSVCYRLGRQNYPRPRSKMRCKPSGVMGIRLTAPGCCNAASITEASAAPTPVIPPSLVLLHLSRQADSAGSENLRGSRPRRQAPRDKSASRAPAVHTRSGIMDGAKCEPYGSTLIENPEKGFHFCSETTSEFSCASFPVLLIREISQTEDRRPIEPLIGSAWSSDIRRL